jgi:AcrR family transcriptional regulator
MAKPLVPVETILETALRLLDEQGAEGLSARNLAAALNCSTRTLYQQVGKRDELVGSLFAYHFANLELEFSPAADWQDTAYNWALSLRTALLDHPNLTRLISADHRAPIASYTTELLKFLRKAGFKHALALSTCRSLVNASMSLTLSELATPEDYARRKRRAAKEIQFEDLIVSQNRGARSGSAPEVFTNTIQWIIKGIEQDLSATAI